MLCLLNLLPKQWTLKYGAMHSHNLVHFLTMQNPLCCDNMLTEIRRLIAFLPGMRKETKNEIAISDSAAGESLKGKSTLNGVNTNCCEKPTVAGRVGWKPKSNVYIQVRPWLWWFPLKIFGCKLDKIILCDFLLPFKVSVLVSSFFLLFSHAHLVFSCSPISYSCSHLLFSIDSGADLVRLFFGPREPTIADLMLLCCVGIFFDRGFPEPRLSERAPVRLTLLLSCGEMFPKPDEQNCFDGVLDSWKMKDNRFGMNNKRVGIQVEIRL